MARDFEKELQDLKLMFPNSDLSHWKEGGIDFIKFINVPGVKNVQECILQVGNFMGYESRIFFPEVISTKHERNWNHKNVLINGKTYNAFSFRVQDGALCDLFLGHLGGIN